jgi:hypothetical protein
VGWTIKERKLLHIKDWHWYNVHIAHVEQQSEKWEIHKPRIIGAILEETKHDWYLNYIKNVMFLETFLKLNKVSYTFYRSLGSTDEFYELDSKKVYNSFKINLTEVSDKNIILNNLLPSISDSANWLTFFEEEKHNSLASHSWTRYMQKTFTWQWHISADNKHPNIKATTMLVDIIKNHLIKNNLL